MKISDEVFSILVDLAYPIHVDQKNILGTQGITSKHIQKNNDVKPQASYANHRISAQKIARNAMTNANIVVGVTTQTRSALSKRIHAVGKM